MKTQTTKEAMDLLRRTRRELIRQARDVARELIARHGKTDTWQVNAEMKKRGMLIDGVPGYWLGAVFNHTDFRWTGAFKSYHKANDPTGVNARNIHERTVKVWGA